MAWVYLFVAGIFEIGFAMGLKYSEGFSRPLPTVGMVVAGAIGFYLPSVAMKGLPVGTAYAIWTGIGAAGTVAPGILFLKESTLARVRSRIPEWNAGRALRRLERRRESRASKKRGLVLRVGLFGEALVLAPKPDRLDRVHRRYFRVNTDL